MTLYRVLSNVILEDCPGQELPCWIWKLSKTKGGYGKTKSNGRTCSVHKFVWQATVGSVTPGLQLDHLCRRRPCCNPHHLEEVTGQINIARGLSGLFRAVHCGPDGRATHCPKGHEYTAENTKIERIQNGRYFGRACRHCLRIKAKAYYRNKKENLCPTKTPP